MKLSIIILNYNVRYFLELCIKSVQAAIANIDAEIIVVDNHSTDDSCNMVKQLFPKVALIQNTENLGFSKGNNIGVSKAKGEYVCILNPDTVVTENTFVDLLKFAKVNQNVGIIGCKLIDGQGHFLPESKRNIPLPFVSIKKIFGFSKAYYANHLKKDNIGKADIFVGAFMLLNKKVYTEVGGFDEDYFMYGEDIDLSYKILKAGYNNYYVGTTTIIHFKGESTLKDNIYAKRFYGAMQIFYNKHFKSNSLFNLMVWFGIKFAKHVKHSNNPDSFKVDRYLLISNAHPNNLEAVLNKPITVLKELNTVNDYTQIIFDANYLDYNTIINQLETMQKNDTITFKILPSNSSFILGSNSSKSRGEVIKF